MRISDRPIAVQLAELGVELIPGVSLVDKTSLGIGGATDQSLARIEANAGAVAFFRDGSPSPLPSVDA